MTDPVSRADARDEVGRAAGRLAAATDPAAISQARSALAAARTADAAARARLTVDIARRASAPDPYATLDARYPVALLPVRLETRFVRGSVAAGPDNTAPINTVSARSASIGAGPDIAGELLVRVYPDSILADSHEPLLTANEVAAGQAYWRRAFTDGTERDAWTALLGTAKLERAAWIVDQTTPTTPLTAGGTPDFPALDTRPDNWHRAPEARGLPDRWIVSAYRGGSRIHEIQGAPIQAGLALTPRLTGDEADGDPSANPDIDLSGDGLSIAPELAWAYDFDTAVTAGMAVRMPLTAADLEQGFDTVLAVGVRTGETADQQAADLDALLTAHRFSRGLAFVAQGTATNNSAEAPSAYPVADPAGAVSFPIVRGPGLATTGTDGARFAGSLGLPATVVDHVAGAGRDEQTAAGAMVRALWPSTVGYFMDQMLAPELQSSTVDGIRAFASGWLRPRGPLPAVRVGPVPYGILPVGAYTGWTEAPDEGVPAGFAEFVNLIAGAAAAHTGDAPRVGRTADPDADLVAVLGMDASARSVRVRRGFGYDTTWNMFGYTGRDIGALQTAQQQVSTQILATVNAVGRDPRGLHLSYLAGSYDFGGPLVGPAPLSETEALAFDYLGWLARATPATLRSQTAPPVPVDALLYLMLRHGLLAEYDAAARRLLTTAGLLLAGEARESELVGILPQRLAGRSRVPTTRTAWERLDLRIPASGNRSLGDYLASNATASANLADVRAAITSLSGTSTAELHRLFTETLDACSHRVDAWLTAFASRRLAALRTAEPTGVYLGCYGWVTDLRADPAGPTIAVIAPDGTNAIAREDSDGYLYAPSMLHAATAAVLRSGYLARSGDDQRHYAVDLSSARVRAALDVLDAVRDSQPLGAVLGYAFERGLHENHPGVELDRFIDDFRTRYPAVANKTEDSGQDAGLVAARTVVDGLALLAASQIGVIDWAGIGADADQRRAITAELTRLDDITDAVSDLLLSESVHQVLKGSTAGAAATLDSLARGHRPPEPDVVATPRGGTVLYQRVAVMFDGAAASGWSAIPATPRAAAAPELDAWLGRLLGDPAEIRCAVTRPDSTAVTVTAVQLGLRPTDLLVLAGRATADELDVRIAAASPGTGPVTIDYDDPTAPVSFGVAREMLAAAGRLIGHGRPLAPADLLTPGATPPDAGPALGRRADAARSALAALRTTIAAGPGAIAAAALYDLPQALGAPVDMPAVIAAIDVKLAAATGTPEAILTAIFGPGLPLVAPFSGPATVEPDLGPDPDGTVEGWLTQVARVQPAVDAWRDVALYGRALGRDIGRPQIAQLPDGGRWAALGFATEADRPRSGLVSVAVVGDPPPPDGAGWCGLLLASWPEIIPAVEEDAGIAVQFDAPGAQAPQAVLLAVPPNASPHWSYPALERTLLDTLGLAKIRALDLAHLGDFGQLLPMTFLAENTAGAAVSTSFAGLLVADTTIGAVQ